MLRENKLVYVNPKDEIVQLIIKDNHDDSDFSWLKKNKYTNIEYVGQKRVVDHPIYKDGSYYVINFKQSKTIDTMIASRFVDFIKFNFESEKNEHKTNEEVLRDVIDYFSKYIRSIEVQILKDNFAEALFLIRCIKLGLNDYILSILNNDYTKPANLSINNNLYKIKSANLSKSDFRVDDETFNDFNMSYIVVKTEFIEDGLDILMAYDYIQKHVGLNEYLLNKFNYYTDNFSIEFIKKVTVSNFDYSIMDLFDKNDFPIIDIIEPRNLKKLIYVINATYSDSLKDDFNDAITKVIKNEK